MIYTLTMNPAIDYVIGVDSFAEGRINRTAYENIFAGGKGINVSAVLGNLGVENVALGFIAGQTGKMFASIAKAEGVNIDFIECESGNTRINVKMKNGDIETEINGHGPMANETECGMLMDKIGQITEGDTLILSGSSLPGVSYENICKAVAGKGVNLVLDFVGKKLLDCLEYQPFLIKPNVRELSDVFGVDISSDDEIIKYAFMLKEMGAYNVMISMAGDGAILIDEDRKVRVCRPPKGSVINSVGAGDTSVAAFVAEYERQAHDGMRIDYSEILRYSVVAGSATAFKSGLATREDIEALL